MLTQLKISGFRSLYDTAIDLTPLTVLVGMNSVGKSNILEALQFLQICVQRGAVPHDPQLWDRVPSHPPLPTLSVAVSFEDRENSDRFDYELSFRVGKRKIVLDTERLSFRGDLFLSCSNGNIKVSPVEPSSILTGNQLALPGLLNDPILQRCFTFLDGGMRFEDFGGHRRGAQRWQRGPRDVHGAVEGTITELTAIAKESPESFTQIEEMLRGIIPGIQGIAIRRSHGKLRPFVIGGGHRKQPLAEQMMSVGLHHLLATVVEVYREPRSQVTIFDEPEAFLHPQAQEVIADLFERVSVSRSTQIITTSHSSVITERVPLRCLRLVSLDDERGTSVKPFRFNTIELTRKALLTEPVSTSTTDLVRKDQVGATATHSEDFTSVNWFGASHSFDVGQQAKAITLLWKEWEHGGFGLHEKTIGERIGSSSDHFRLAHVFRNHPAWKTMIQSTGRRGCYCLAKQKESQNPQ